MRYSEAARVRVGGGQGLMCTSHHKLDNMQSACGNNVVNRIIVY